MLPCAESERRQENIYTYVCIVIKYVWKDMHETRSLDSCEKGDLGVDFPQQAFYILNFGVCEYITYPENDKVLKLMHSMVP